MAGPRSDNEAVVAARTTARARRRVPVLAAVCGAALSVLGPEARAEKVVVFPLDARGVEPGLTLEGTRAVLARLRRVRGVEVVDPETGKAELGVGLTQQARACEYDVFCLVEVGELLEAERVLIGHLSRPLPTDARADEGLELKLIVLDVSRATITEVLLWRVPDLDPSALVDAARAAVSRLFAPKDVELIVALTPPEARISLYGEQLSLPEGGRVPFWSGVYHALVTAPGYQPERARIPVMPGEGPVRVAVTLEPDPLYVAEVTGPVKVFEQDSRRLGSGASAQTVGAVPSPDEAPTPAYQSLPPWLVAGAGVGMVALGSVLMQGAQSRYNDRAAERRYISGETFTADVAIRERDENRTRYRAGSGVVLGGVGLLVGAGVWMLVDAALARPARQTAAGPAAPGPRSGALEPAALRAVRRLALEAGR
jgi:hypothetical protein